MMELFLALICTPLIAEAQQATGAFRRIGLARAGLLGHRGYSALTKTFRDALGDYGGPKDETALVDWLKTEGTWPWIP